MDFNKIEITDEENVQVPHSRYNYQPLIKQARLLTVGKVMKVPIKKIHQQTSITNALSRFEKNRKYRVYRATENGQMFAVVKLAEGYK